MKKTALIVPLALAALTLTGCGGEGEVNKPPASSSEAPTEAEADEAALEEAQATLTSFFQTKATAEDSLSAKIDAQAKFLTDRSVHPSVAYEKGYPRGPMGVEEQEVVVQLTNARRVEGQIMVDFKTDTSNISYPFLDGKMIEGEGTPGWSRWDGTATLDQVGDQWLISNLTMESIGGGSGTKPTPRGEE